VGSEMGQQSNEQTEILKEILKWIRFAGAKEVKAVLISTLDTQRKILIYHLSDGSRTSIDIAKAASTSDTTVRNYWASWARQGIVESLKVRGGERYRKSFELEDFGIRVPEVTVTKLGEVKSSAETEPGENA
jgi:predicted ArsR family transcriptional regulator